MNEIGERVDQEMLLLADTPAQNSLEELNKIKKKFDDQRRKATTYLSY